MLLETDENCGRSHDFCIQNDASCAAPPAYDEVDHIRTDIGKLIAGADGFAQVYPQHKFIIVDVLRQLGYRVGMTGDGVNDAAAMKVADVGVCVEGGACGF